MSQPSIILSHHAKERQALRAVSEEMIIQTLKNPDKTYPGDKKGSHKFIKQHGNRRVYVVASYLADQKKWLIISTWVRGETDPVPLSWLLITAPFRLAWWLMRRLYVMVTSR